LAELFAAYRPEQVVTRRGTYEDLPAYTDEALALAKALKKRGFTFVGPTNVYAMMQALGLVDDHLATCPVSVSTLESPHPSRTRDIWDEVSHSTVLLSEFGHQPSL